MSLHSLSQQMNHQLTRERFSSNFNEISQVINDGVSLSNLAATTLHGGFQNVSETGINGDSLAKSQQAILIIEQLTQTQQRSFMEVTQTTIHSLGLTNFQQLVLTVWNVVMSQKVFFTVEFSPNCHHLAGIAMDFSMS